MCWLCIGKFDVGFLCLFFDEGLLLFKVIDEVFVFVVLLYFGFKCVLVDFDVFNEIGFIVL